MKTLLITIAVTALSLPFASPASAEPVTVRTAVSTAGLDLSTPAGAQALDLRILHAASAVCGTPSPADPRGRAKLDDCRDDLRDQARDQIARRSGAVEIASRR